MFNKHVPCYLFWQRCCGLSDAGSNYSDRKIIHRNRGTALPQSRVVFAYELLN